MALVTGARIKIGFHVALKLLRCGAEVRVQLFHSDFFNKPVAECFPILLGHG